MAFDFGDLFEDGPILRLLDFTDGSTQEDDLVRFCRTVRNSPQADWVMPLNAVAALLELTAEKVSTAAPGTIPERFGQKLHRAAGDMAGPEYLRMLAELIRPFDRQAVPSVRELPLGSLEIRVRFPRTIDFGLSWIAPGEHTTDEEAITAGVESEHPSHCLDVIPLLAAEVQELLMLFPSDEELTHAVRGEISWVSRPVLDDIIRLAAAHMAQPH
ncbi:hypothetical protein ACFWDI_33350 [Streptomyces sp. NPDC060064]|uniref:hypothetical protein n=1 Tax=Streptomyces sp. NPDC060064 TaxID=3347049 RepID=UPI0036C561AF